jgi:zinc transport system ATP-binding protein
MEPIVSLKDVTVRYDEITALESVSLDIYPNDFLGIIGPNGGGKTTLVKAILGALPHSGKVAYAPTLSEGGHRLIGYLPQQAEFDRSFPITVVEVVMSGLQAEKGLFSRYTKADRERAMKLLEMAGIEAIADRQISEVSGGQMQRALLCRAIIAEPKLLILDEPTNFVDNRFEYEFYNMVKGLSHKMAIVIVSHDLGTITSVVKSIVCVNKSVHRHDSNILTEEQLQNYNCPIQILSHGHIPHTVLAHHSGDCCHDHE